MAKKNIKAIKKPKFKVGDVVQIIASDEELRNIGIFGVDNRESVTYRVISTSVTKIYNNTVCPIRVEIGLTGSNFKFYISEEYLELVSREEKPVKKLSDRDLEINGAISKHAEKIYNLEKEVKQLKEKLNTVYNDQKILETEILIRTDRLSDRMNKYTDQFNKLLDITTELALDVLKFSQDNCKHDYEFYPFSIRNESQKRKNKFGQTIHRNVLVGTFKCSKCGKTIIRELTWREKRAFKKSLRI